MRFCKLLSIALVIGLIFPPAGFSANIVVPGVYPTIQGGIDAFYSGDTVTVAPGTYMENIDIQSKRIVLISSGGPDVTVIKSASSGTAVVTNDSDINPVVLIGFTIDGASISTGIYFIGANPTIRDCEIKNCINGITCVMSSAQIKYNVIHDNSAKGMAIVGSHFVEISYNEVYNNSGESSFGISVGPHDMSMESSNISIHHNLVRDNTGGIFTNVDNCEIKNNTVVNNGQGIKIQYSESVTILNNIVVSSQYEGIIPEYVVVDYNNMWNNGSANDPGLNGISLDPLFIDESNNDYKLQTISPCINTGDPDPLYNDPDGSRNDIGAFRYIDGLICGDLNSDYLVNIFDITLLISYLYKDGPAPDPINAADLNNDSIVNIFDITYLITYLYKGGPEPVCQ